MTLTPIYGIIGKIKKNGNMVDTINYKDKMFCCQSCDKKRKCAEKIKTLQWCFEYGKQDKIGRDTQNGTEKPL